MAVDANTVYIAIGLVAAFVIAFKVMEIVFEVFLISLLSGVFYVGMSQVFGYPLTINDIALFSLAGTVFYILYSVLASVYSTASSMAEIPGMMAGLLLQRLRPRERIKDKIKEYKRGKEEKVRNDSSEGGGNVKEVVIDKVSEKGSGKEEED